VRRIVLSLLAVVVVLVGVFAVGVVTLIRKPIPDTSGEVTLAGLDGEVVIRRDAHGVPHITAETASDLFFAQGFVHAQDRFHEMDVRRHVAAGRLSELIGNDGAGPDRLIRALRIPQRAQRDARSLPMTARRAVDAYTRGINAYSVGRPGSSLGLEYTAKTLVGRDYRPEPWRPVDSVAWTALLDWSLATGVTDEIDRILIDRHMPLARVGELYPGVDMAETAAARAAKEFAGPAGVPALLALRESVAMVPKVTGIPHVTGTDAWVDGSVLTARLASTIAVPAPWYPIGLHCAKVSAACPFDVSGMSLSGVPGVVVGRNATVAWGLSPTPIEQARLEIAARRGDAAGPIVATLPNGHVVALQWDRLANRPTISGVLALNQASSVAAVAQAGERLRLPFALVYLDAAGRSGRVPAGAAPARMGARSQAADLLVPWLLRLRLDSQFAAQGQRTLKGWDHRMTVGEPAAAYFASVWSHVLARTFHDEVPWAQWPDGSARWTAIVGKLLNEPNSTWWDNLSTPQIAERRDDILRIAMVEARDELTRIRARDVSEWDWGNLHGPRLENPTLSGRLFERGPIHLGGSGDTVEGTAWNPAIGYGATVAPVAKVVADLHSPDRSRWILATGVSGHPFSRHYTDQTEPWSRGATIPWPWSARARDRAADDVLRLRSPAG
jgi:acyl-homoserine lactone acylase PvdQ